MPAKEQKKGRKISSNKAFKNDMQITYWINLLLVQTSQFYILNSHLKH